MFEVVTACLKETEDYCLRDVSIPPISTGIFKFPKRLCAKIIFEAIEIFSIDHARISSRCDYLNKVNIVIMDDITLDVFKDEFKFRYEQN